MVMTMAENSTHKARDQDAVEAEASAWLVRLEGEDFTDEDQAALDAWFQQSPDHERVFRDVAETWNIMALAVVDAHFGAQKSTPLAGGHATSLLGRLKDAFRKRWFTPAFATGFAALALVAVVSVLFEPGGRPAMPYGQHAVQQFVTAVGRQSLETLEDGSRIRLNTDTKLSAQISEQSRTVELIKGEAMFTVARDVSKPFIIKAGNHEVRVLGTVFSVQKRPEGITVRVQSGRVAVSSEEGEGVDSVILTEGQQVLANDDSGMGAAQTLDVEQAFAWTNGLLIFDGTALPDALAEIDRYYFRDIQLQCDQAQSKKLSGVFRIDGLDEALEVILADASLQMDTHVKGKLLLQCPIDPEG